MSTKGQTLNDRFNAAKYTLAGQALARCIYKATTEELMRPKKKHLDYLAACTYQTNVSMQELANLLIERTNNAKWAVVYKALITIHHLMNYGSERFPQYLASSNYSFQLSNFLDRNAAKGYAMSTFIRRYSNYINQRALSYRALAIDLCRAKRKTEDGGTLKTMPIERILETLPVVEKQLDALMEFGCTVDDLNNSIITTCFTLLFSDTIRLFASYNDGIINLIGKYFDLNKKMCREAFEAYKKFLASTDKVAEFLKVAEAINLNNGQVPDFKRAPSSLLDVFEQHLNDLEANKKRDTTRQTDVERATTAGALPSFSFDTNFDEELSSEKQQQQQDDRTTVGDLPNELEAQLTFAESFSDFEIKADPIVPLAKQVAANNKPKPSQASTVAELAKKPINQEVFALTSASDPFSSDSSATLGAGTNHSSSADLFDIQPPGFSDGALLTPEALQISLDPSIDLHTQQQLMQIKREQIANKQHNNNNSTSFNSGGTQTRSSNNSSTRGGFAKPTKESMFEDLEKTMRESLFNRTEENA